MGAGALAMSSAFCPATDCRVTGRDCARECRCRPCNCLRCRERTAKARDPLNELYRPQDHATAPARQEIVKRRLSGTPQESLF